MQNAIYMHQLYISASFFSGVTFAEGYMIHLEWRPYTAADGTAPKTLWHAVTASIGGEGGHAFKPFSHCTQMTVCIIDLLLGS